MNNWPLTVVPAPSPALHLLYRSRAFILALCAGLCLAGLVVLGLGCGPGCGGTAAAPDGCTPIYQDADWTLSTCPEEPGIPATMAVWLDGVQQPEPAARLEIAHVTGDGTGRPTVAVLYASGFVRLKPNADPTPPIPFGTSAVLGPAYWAGGVYHHHPTLESVHIVSDWLPNGPLRMTMKGHNADFEVGYAVTVPPPTDDLTRWHVAQVYTATAAIALDGDRLAHHEGFRLVQFSSMFLNGGHDGYHDADGARIIGADGARRQVAFAAFAEGASGWVFSPTVALGDVWLDALHGDDQGWQGNTPRTQDQRPHLRLALDALPEAGTVTPQGWISATSDPNQDNVGLWLHDDGATGWSVGQSGVVGYWILAQDAPPEPWSALGLRSGWTFLDFEAHGSNCFFVHDPAQGTAGTVYTMAGYTDTALELSYDLGSADGNWAQVRCDFDPPLDLSAYDHLRFDWRGDPDAANSLEVGLIDRSGAGQRIFGRGYHHATHRDWWGQLVVPFSFLAPWEQGTAFDPTQVVAFMLSVVKDGGDDGGTGRIAIDNLNAYNVGSRVISRPVLTGPSTPVTNAAATAAAAQWLASQQQPTGLLKSWAEEPTPTAHIYDQALALLVFSHAEMWTQADAAVEGLAQAQEDDGSWYKSYDAGDGALPCVHCHRWEGDVAWAIYALGRYRAAGGTHPQAGVAMERAADWLAGRVGADGCLVITHTEGTIDAWWALQSTGLERLDQAEGLEKCLLTQYWDGEMGRFKGGREWRQPYLDNQTWGGPFLDAVGREEDALRALSYAYEVLRLPARGGQLFGFDGQAGPWSMWNEGTGQYAAAALPFVQEDVAAALPFLQEDVAAALPFVEGYAAASLPFVQEDVAASLSSTGSGAVSLSSTGSGAEAFAYELMAQQRSDGAMPGSPEDFSGGGVWTARWHGVAPTAWLYFALTPGEPFQPTIRRAWLPAVLTGDIERTPRFTEEPRRRPRFIGGIHREPPTPRQPPLKRGLRCQPDWLTVHP